MDNEKRVGVITDAIAKLSTAAVTYIWISCFTQIATVAVNVFFIFHKHQ